MCWLIWPDNDVIALAERLDGLPLALATAGAYLRQVTTSWARYLSLYHKSWLRLQETSPKIDAYEDRALYSTWDLSYEHICLRNPLAGKLLQLWAHLDNQDLWYELLAAEILRPTWFSDLIGDELGFQSSYTIVVQSCLN